MATQSKICPICRDTFMRPADYSHVQWRNRRFCSKQCSEEQKRRTRSAKRRCNKCGSQGPFHSYKTSSGRISSHRLCIKCRNKVRRKKRKTPKERKKQNAYVKRFRDRVRESEPHRITHSKAWATRNPERYLFHRMNCNVHKHRGRIARMMTYEQFLMEIGGKLPDSCPIFGIPLSFALSPKSDGLPTVDRINSLRPYEVGNVAVISWRANIIKNMGTAEEHRKIADWIDKISGVPALRAA